MSSPIFSDLKSLSLPSFPLGFRRKEFRGKLAIAITANFINRNTTAEAKVEEISGVAFIFNQKFFQELREATGWCQRLLSPEAVGLGSHGCPCCVLCPLFVCRSSFVLSLFPRCCLHVRSSVTRPPWGLLLLVLPFVNSSPAPSPALRAGFSAERAGYPLVALVC